MIEDTICLVVNVIDSEEANRERRKREGDMREENREREDIVAK
jgi:hypothetical protein